MLVSGEAGIGKTTLVQGLIYEAEERNCLVLTGGCYDLTTTPPYGPWIEITRAYLAPDDSLPDLPDQFRQGGGMAGIDSQEELFELIRAFFAAVSSQRPLVLVLEDLHWADPASLEALRYLSRSLGDAEILLVVTYRDDEITRDHELYPLLPVLVRESRAQRIHLNPLDQQAIHELVECRYALSEPDVARLVAHLVARSEGNPFFAGEILQGLEEEQVLEASSEGWRLGLLEHVHVPALLRQVLDVRFSRLSSETRAALQIASVIGHTVPLLLWQEVGGFDSQAIDRVITEALETRMLEEVATADALQFHHALLREALYESLSFGQRRMVHLRIAEALSAMPNPDPDEVAHHFQHAADPRAISWLIRAGVRAEGSYAIRAAVRHYETVDRLLKASPRTTQGHGWLHLRICDMLVNTDMERSLAYFEEAMSISLRDKDQVLTAFSLSKHGLLRCVQGDLETGLQEMERAIAIMDQVTEEQLESANQAIASLFPSEIFSDSRVASGSVFYKIGRLPGVNHLIHVYTLWLAIAGRFQDALDIGTPFVQQAEAATDDRMLIQDTCGVAYFGLGIAASWLGQLQEARKWFVLALDAFTALGHHHMVRNVESRRLEHLLVYHADRLPDRRQAAGAAHAAAERVGGTWGGYPANMFALPLDMVEGRWDDARVLVRRSFGDHLSSGRDIRRWVLGVLGSELRNEQLAAAIHADVQKILPDGPATEPGRCAFAYALVAQRLSADVALEVGDLETARAWIVAQDRWLERSGSVRGQAENHLLWGRYHRIAGDLEMARWHADQALAHASTPRQPLAIIAAQRYIGRLAVEAERFDEATDHLQASLELAERCEAPYEQALTMLAMAELAVRRGDLLEARRLLRDVRATCESLDAQRTLDRVNQLLATMSERADAYPAGLSAREVEVLEQAATGMTNAEIGETLYISPRTVAQHLRSVYNKLGVNSRTAAVTRWAELNSASPG